MTFTDRPLTLFTVIILIISAVWFLTSLSAKPAPSLASTNSENQELAPDLQGISAWLNSEPLESMESLRGKVVLIDFWTYSCINCIRTLPYLVAWDDAYRDDGLVIIGVHTPEFAFEKDVHNVQQALNKYKIKFPVALDNNYLTWRAYQNRYWPHKFLIDKNGFIRYDHIGEGAYQETEIKIKELLAETGSLISDETVDLVDTTPRSKNTPELYAGFSFALPRDQSLGNKEDFQVGKIFNYTKPNSIPDDKITLVGLWESSAEFLEAKSDGSVFLKFTASQAHIVAESNTDQGVTILLDGELSTQVFGSPQLYTVYDGSYGEYTLELQVKEGFRMNAFTFG